MFSRKARPLDELLKDPHFPYQVGRLIGASEMVSHWLELQKDETAQEMGRKLGTVVDWYFEEENGIPTKLGTDELTGHKEPGQHSDSESGSSSRTRQSGRQDKSTSV